MTTTAVLELILVALIILLLVVAVSLRDFVTRPDTSAHLGSLGLAAVPLVVGLGALGLTEMALRPVAPAETVEDAFWRKVLSCIGPLLLIAFALVVLKTGIARVPHFLSRYRRRVRQA